MEGKRTKTHNSITIATTIAPHGDLSKQRKALTSWTDKGFRLISVNAVEEIEFLKPQFTNVEFYSAYIDGRSKFNRPYIYLDQVFEVLKRHGSELCGIVNSDIFLGRQEMCEYIAREAGNALVFGARMDVASLDDLSEGCWYEGFDYFFFKQNMLSNYPAEEFCIGLPWWDYWMILIPLAKKLPVKRIMSPVVFHEVHSRRYGLDSWTYLGLKMSHYFIPRFRLTRNTMGMYNRILFEAIDKNPAIAKLQMQ